MKIPIPGRHGGWWFGVSWNKQSHWGYFNFWNDGPMHALWCGNLCFELWWR